MEEAFDIKGKTAAVLKRRFNEVMQLKKAVDDKEDKEDAAAAAKSDAESTKSADKKNKGKNMTKESDTESTKSQGKKNKSKAKVKESDGGKKGILKESKPKDFVGRYGGEIKYVGRRPIIYVDEDERMTAKDLAIIWNAAEKHDREKWLMAASRYFDKTGRRVDENVVRTWLEYTKEQKDDS